MIQMAEGKEEMMSLWVYGAVQGFSVSFDFLISSLITDAIDVEMQEPPLPGCLTGIWNQYVQSPSQYPRCEIPF